MRIALAAGLVAAVWHAGVGAEEASPACDAFTADAEYIERIVSMQLEGVNVMLRLPVQYIEDRSGGVEFADRKQFFSVDLNNWTPVSRLQSAKRDQENRDDFIWFTVRDFAPLDELALLAAQTYGEDAPTELPSGRDGPANLTWLNIGSSSASAAPYRDLFVGQGADGRLDAVIQCNALPASISVKPGCDHIFRAAGLDVGVSYRRVHLDRWREIQSDVTAFLSCATAP